MDALQCSGYAAIVANTVVKLAGLAVLGGVVPLTLGRAVSTYAAVFPMGEDVRAAVASLNTAGAGWRVLRVVASHPVPILMLAHVSGGGPRPHALLLPVPAVPTCIFTLSGRTQNEF